MSKQENLTKSKTVTGEYIERGNYMRFMGMRKNEKHNDVSEKRIAEKKSSMVKILGSGCKKCNELEANTAKALEQLGIDEKITHITDFVEIAQYGVMSTPAIVFKEKVISYGKVLKPEEIATLIRNEI